VTSTFGSWADISSPQFFLSVGFLGTNAENKAETHQKESSAYIS
jgi:hypothetical protein